MRKFFHFFLILSVLTSFSSCKSLTKTVEVPVYIHDTTQTVKVQHDSTYIDRWHSVEVKGDTVYITNEVTKTVTKIQTDTAYKYIERPIPVTHTETVEVKKPLSWWQKTFMWMGVWGLMGLIDVLIWKTKKWWIKLFV